MIKNKKERKTMSNTYDIEIKMNYFLEGSDYHSSLEDLHKFKALFKDHLNYWEEICSNEERFKKEWNDVYGE